MHMIILALRSLWHRRMTAMLTIASISISVALLLLVLVLKTAAWRGFSNTIADADLLVGARSGPLNLLLYSIFHLGEPANGVSWESYQKIARHRDVAWTIPLSLGDSHRGYRVVGTNADFFAHYRFGEGQSLQFQSGHVFVTTHDAIVGADVAAHLRYQVGTSLTLTHGLGDAGFAEHRDHAFQVVGILEPTGTPVDQSVMIPLEGMTAIHAGKANDVQTTANTDITAFIVGMRNTSMTLIMQRAINEYQAEPLTAVLPGVALSQLWSLTGKVESVLMILAGCVVMAGLMGMMIGILTTLTERRREMSILRSVGARPIHVVGLLVAEAGLLSSVGVIAGVALAWLLMLLGRVVIQQRYGILLGHMTLASTEYGILTCVVLCACMMGLIPAWMAYRNSLNDGLMPRL